MNAPKPDQIRPCTCGSVDIRICADHPETDAHVGYFVCCGACPISIGIRNYNQWDSPVGQFESREAAAAAWNAS